MRETFKTRKSIHLHLRTQHRAGRTHHRIMGQMTTLKEIALELYKAGQTIALTTARKYAEHHYDVVLPAYLTDGHASYDLLDALMSAYTSGNFNDAIKAALKINTALEQALDHAADLIYDEMLELQYEDEDQSKYDSRESFERHQWYGDRVKRPVPPENLLGLIATDQSIPF